MKLPERREKGFTLIELLIVVAILGVLAAVVIPNVGRFLGSGKTEAAATELSTLQSAVQSMMVDKGISQLPAGDYATGANATYDMTIFPSTTYPLYSVSNTSARYVAQAESRGVYTVDQMGTVTQNATTH